MNVSELMILTTNLQKIYFSKTRQLVVFSAAIFMRGDGKRLDGIF